MATAVVFLLFLFSRDELQNYEAVDGPLFIANYVETPPAFTGEIKVISWNIKFAEKMDQAISELQSITALQAADVLLLQEMDETAVDDIAQTLGYNHVYFPASVHNQTGRNFGNAILSVWPLTNPKKILLPHENPTNQQTRNAVQATAVIAGQDVQLVSVHTETIWLSDEKRKEQVDALVAAIEPDAEIVIVGGDFNTVSEGEVTAVADRFTEIGMDHVSAGAEPTVIKAGLAITADHVFARGVTLIENGVWLETEASDHFPVWVHLTLDKD